MWVLSTLMSSCSVGSPIIFGTISGKPANIVAGLVGDRENVIFRCFYSGAACAVDANKVSWFVS